MTANLLTTTPAQKMELKERAKDADEISLSRFIIKILKKHGISPLNFYHFFLVKFLHSKTLAKEKLFRIIINPKASKKD